MKKLNAVQRRATKIGLAMAGMAGAGALEAQVTVPAAITTLIDDASAMAVAVIALGVVAYAGYRGGLVALSVGKRILSKIGL